MSDSIDSILATRRQQEQPERFFSVLRAEGINEDFFELRFRNGTKTCLSYRDLSWFNYSPEDNAIDLEFGGFLVVIRGRGLCPKLFDAIKGKRVAWVREADSGFQDNPEFESFVESITIAPPEGFGEEG